MNLKISSIALASALSLGTSVALADTSMISGNHFHAGLGLGYGKIITDKYDLKDGGFAYNAYLGHLWFVDNMAYGAELGFTGYPKTKKENDTVGIKANSIDLLAVGKYYPTPEFNLTLKAGAAVMMQTFNTQTTLDGLTKTSFIPVIALGIGYQVMENVSLTLENKFSFGKPLSKFDDNARDLNIAKIVKGKLRNPTNTILAGVTYTF